MTFPEPVRKLLKEFEAETETHLLDVTPSKGLVGSHRDDVRRLILAPGEISLHDLKYDDLKNTLERRLRDLKWQFSEVHDRQDLIYIAPMLFCWPEIAFHATRIANVPSIFKHGLLRSTPELSNSERADCRGKIYVCPTLGAEPANPDSEPRKETAHWWRWHLSTHNRFNDPEWSILEVKFTELNVRVYRDIWSASGLIVDGIASIPAEHLSIVWPDNEVKF